MFHNISTLGMIWNYNITKVSQVVLFKFILFKFILFKVVLFKSAEFKMKA